MTPPPPAAPQRAAGRSRQQADGDARSSRLRADLRAHPCHGCPDREDHARWAERYLKLDRDTETLQRRIEQRTNTIARQFDRVCEVLTALGYLEGDDGHRDRRRALMRIYTEHGPASPRSRCGTGLWDGLSPPRAGRGPVGAGLRGAPPRRRRRRRGCRGAGARRCSADMVSLWADLDALERDHQLDFLREPDLGFAWAAYRWAEGGDLDDVLNETDLAAGDFVRWMKQLLDLADQVADAAGDGQLRHGRARAVERRCGAAWWPTPRCPTDRPGVG